MKTNPPRLEIFKTMGIPLRLLDVLLIAEVTPTETAFQLNSMNQYMPLYLAD